MLYSAKLSSKLHSYGMEEHVGIREPPWKTRFGNHKLFLNNRNHCKCTIAKKVLNIKHKGGHIDISWVKINRTAAYHPVAKICKFCLTEKLHIVEIPNNIINQVDELVSKCCHQNKFSLMKNAGLVSVTKFSHYMTDTILCYINDFLFDVHCYTKLKIVNYWDETL